MPQLIYYCFIKYCSMYYLLEFQHSICAKSPFPEFQSIPPANAISGIVIIETKVDIAITSDA